MKIMILSLLFASFVSICVAQSPEAIQLVKEGTALHDKADFSGAIKKYDEALALSPDYVVAMYEKSYTQFSSKQYEACIELSKKILSLNPDEEMLKRVYVTYGSALDVSGNSKKALQVYDQGLKKIPNYFLLHFNKGITYRVMNDNEKSFQSFKAALLNNPLHASSYFRISEMLGSNNKFPAIMVGLMQLIIEPEGERAVYTSNRLEKWLMDGVKKTGDKTTMIFLSPTLLDKKKKKKEDDFFMAEMMFVLSAAASKDSINGKDAVTTIEKFEARLKVFIASLPDDEKGFFAERYVPFFKALEKEGHLTTLSKLVFSTSKDERNEVWLRVNAERIGDLYEWVKQYKWPE